MSRTTLISRIAATGAALLATLLLAPATGQAATITSDGPLTAITVNPDLSCQVRHSGEQTASFDVSAETPACGTYLARGDKVYGPTNLIPFHQSGPFGEGTPDNPRRLFVTACAGIPEECSTDGATAPLVRIAVRYVDGQESFRTDVSVDNYGDTEERFAIYQYGDCVVGADDEGFGFFDPPTGGIYCTENPAPVTGGIVGFVPITSGGTSDDSRMEGAPEDLQRPIQSGDALDNTCRCDEPHDHAIALAWTGITLPVDGSAGRSFLTTVSPSGVLVEAPRVTLTAPQDGYSSPDNRVDFGGTAGTAAGDSPSVLVEIFEGDVVTDNPYTDRQADVVEGGWFLEDVYLEPGIYTARASQTNDSGNEGFSNTVTFEIEDTSAITLEPLTAENPVGTQHTVTATLTTNRNGDNQARPIFFRVSGANDAAGWLETNADGRASFTYTGENAGVDTITACADLDRRGGDSLTALGVGALLVGFCPDEDEPTATAQKSWFTPETFIDSGPSGPTNDTTPRFEFSSDQPEARFECRVDGGDFVPCASPYTTSELSEGPHTFEVRASDAFNTDPTPAISTFFVDATPPETTITDGPRSPTQDTTPTFAFISNAEDSTFECRVDGGDWVACASPYTTGVLGAGSHTFEVRAIDAAANADAAPAIRSFVIDTAPPQTAITDGPQSPTQDTTPAFAFSSSEANSTFECRIDNGEFTSCTSPYTAAALADGTHTFEVRATDAAGNTDPSPAIRAFVVDTTAPDTTIATGPSGTTGDATPAFEFYSSEPGSTFECSVDGGDFQPCTSPFTPAPALDDGEHTFAVRAIDAADNTDGSPASRTFVIDTTGPETTITAGPTGTTGDARPTFAFSSSEPGSTFECSIDGGGFAPCTSPHTTGELDDGEHTFAVRATDGLGNVDDTPATRTFVVDTVGPETAITSGPPPSSQASTATFTFSAPEGSTFECRIDNNGFAPCTSPYTTGPLSEGQHTFQVRATDARGNTGPVESRTFVRDNTPPQTQILFPPEGATRSRPALVFSSEPGSTFRCRVDSEPFAPCTSPYITDASLPDGPHTFDVQATDPAGNVGPVSSRGFVRDSTPPDAAIDTGPTGSVENPQPTFAFSASEPGSTFECSVDGGDFVPCTSPFTTPALPAGEHTFAVRARDSAGNTSAPVTRTFTVAAPAVPPPAGTGSGSPAASGTPASATAGTPASSTTPNPTAGDRDGDGIPDAQDACPDANDPNQADSDKDKIGNACENSEASGGPQLGESVVGRIVSGQVYVRRPNSNGLRGGARAAQASGTPRGFVPLKGAELLPVGTIVHSTRGRLSITSASGPRAGQTQRADFYRGIFTIRQKKARLPVTDLAVQSANFRQVCGSTTRSTAATSAQAAQAGGFAFVQKKRSKRVVSRLWGSGKGRFRTTGRRSAATVRGTRWLTQERCDGTLTYVASGSVSVRDLRRKKTIIVRAGRAYLARRP